MISKKKNFAQIGFFSSFDDTLSQKPPLYVLASKVDWKSFEDAFQLLYCQDEPDIQCISKGKEHKKYEFGNRVSIVYSLSGVIAGAIGFKNEYDGHTLEPALQQVEALTGKSPKTASVDRGIGEGFSQSPFQETMRESK